MKTAVREALNELYELEQDNGGDITNLAPDDPQLLRIRGILWHNVDEEPDLDKKPTDQEIVQYMMGSNESICKTAKHFHIGLQRIRNAIKNKNLSKPCLYRHQLIKDKRTLYAKSLADINGFFHMNNIGNVTYAKENGFKINGWLIYDCRLISWNVPKFMKLDELLKLDIE